MSERMPMGLMIAVINRTFKRKMDERACKMGLTSVQLRVLGDISMLEASGTTEINQKDLEKMEQVTHPTMTGIIQRLESKGFVECVPSLIDRRYKRISCTPKSTGIYRELDAQDEEVLSEICTGLTTEQKQEFVHIAELILKNISV